MRRKKTRAELKNHKKQALSKLESYLDKLISSDDENLQGKSDKLSYWISDWTTFLDFENTFSPNSLRRYKRGEIIKVHLGFNIGSEEGGLHYAIVIEKDNPKSSPVLTIVHLTSVKPNTDVNNLKSGSIFLGNELFTNLSVKISSTCKHVQEDVNLFKQLVQGMDSEISEQKRLEVLDKINQCNSEIDLLKRMATEVQKMKKGSIALTNQITTISKIRIYDPKTDHDVLSGVKLSNEKLDLIDNEIRTRFTNF